MRKKTIHKDVIASGKKINKMPNYIPNRKSDGFV